MVRQRTAVESNRNEGVRELRPWYLSGWLFFGVVWGVALGDASRHANQKHDLILGALKAHKEYSVPYYDGFAFDASMLALTLILAGLVALYLLVGLIAFVRRRSFWLTTLGVFMGIGGASAMHKFYVAFGLFGRV